MTANDFFQKIQNRYGLSVETLKQIWEQSRVDDKLRHVKRFKLHVEKLAGEAPFDIKQDNGEYDISITAENAARIFLDMDLCKLEEEVANYIEEMQEY